MKHRDKLKISILKRLLKTDKQKAKDLLDFSTGRRETLDSLLAILKRGYSEAEICFSQSGEDMILNSFFGDKSKGFYVDIGANHPTRFSNTHHFYLKGWRGLNIDPIPGAMDLFNKIRPGDLNIELAIGRPEFQDFFLFDESCYNTFDQKIADDILKNNTSRLADTIRIKKSPLSEVLDQYLPSGQSVDLLTIDCEGLDMEILESNNWSRYNPEYICVECHDSFESTQASAHEFLQGKGYRLAAKTKLSEVFKLT